MDHSAIRDKSKEFTEIHQEFEECEAVVNDYSTKIRNAQLVVDEHLTKRAVIISRLDVCKLELNALCAE